jgi:hypothetical protein
MKKWLIKLVLTFVIFCSIVFQIIQTQDMTVNLHMSDITDTHHTYKLYHSWTDAIFDINPIKECRIPIMPNGNYPGNPTPNQFKQWKDVSSYNAGWFKVSNL